MLAALQRQADLMVSVAPAGDQGPAERRALEGAADLAVHRELRKHRARPVRPVLLAQVRGALRKAARVREEQPARPAPVEEVQAAWPASVLEEGRAARPALVLREGQVARPALVLPEGQAARRAPAGRPVRSTTATCTTRFRMPIRRRGPFVRDWNLRGGRATPPLALPYVPPRPLRK